MKRLIAAILLIPFLISCKPEPMDCITKDEGPVNDSLLVFIPYQDNNTYQFRHSAGEVINFQCSRETKTYVSPCEEGMNIETIYQKNNTLLSPDYPLFDIKFSISSYTGSNGDIKAGVGNSGFDIPITPQVTWYYGFLDSLELNGTTYYDVFRLRSRGQTGDSQLYADSIYYNYSKGIIKIIMTNDEYYEIVN